MRPLPPIEPIKPKAPVKYIVKDQDMKIDVGPDDISLDDIRYLAIRQNADMNISLKDIVIDWYEYRVVVKKPLLEIVDPNYQRKYKDYRNALKRYNRAMKKHQVLMEEYPKKLEVWLKDWEAVKANKIKQLVDSLNSGQVQLWGY